MRMPSHQQPSWVKFDVAGPPVPQYHSDYPRVAKHALVLGPSGHVKPTVPDKAAESVNSALQSDFSQEFVKPKPTCLARRALAIKE